MSAVNRLLGTSRMWLRITTVVAVLVLAAPLAAEAQEAQKVPRIGILHQIPPSATFQAFRNGLQELGYVEGQQILLDYRWPEGRAPKGLLGPRCPVGPGQGRCDPLTISAAPPVLPSRPRTPFPLSSAQWG